MADMDENDVLVASVGMLIRRPPAAVFEAFVDPAITTQFWFTKSSGPLAPGRRVKWEWEMYNVSTEVEVQAIEPDRRIVIEWDGYANRTTVEWQFNDRGDGTTFVEIKNSGFGGDLLSRAKQTIDSTSGFALVVAGAKAWLEHGIELNLIGDRFPEGKG